ncbi:MAG: hypothetical protein MUO35_05280 [Anaerolineales bacterium]|nr:hypothetical protein [Anaerolineales bacterium]
MTFARLLVWAWAKVGVLAVEAAQADMGSADAQLRLLAAGGVGDGRPPTDHRAARPGAAAKDPMALGLLCVFGCMQLRE